eukprot:TRINITY_DN15154_c0_g1_i2.p1 TRINITY_DN15154_c0_g1~~TRINITY_DN15154_c0_g1_i2.p1  ORF type:complete len:486 (-),score=72.98 TRINITY_DN15154_c0_g1_i2:169-1626(-)
MTEMETIMLAENAEDIETAELLETAHRPSWKPSHALFAATAGLIGIVAVVGLYQMNVKAQLPIESPGSAIQLDSVHPSPEMYPDGEPNCECPHNASVNLFPLPKLTIHIDHDGKADYKSALEKISDEQKTKIRAVIAGFKQMDDFQGIFHHVCGMQENMLDAMNSDLIKAGEEVPEVAEALGVDVCDVLFLSIMYDIAGGCTSGVANTPDGKIVHGRNLDYMAFPTDIKKAMPISDDIRVGAGKLDGVATIEDLTFEMTFVLPNGDSFSGPNYVGYVGMLTGARSGGLSISLNQRYPRGQAGSALNWQAAFPDGRYDQKYVSPSLWIRTMLQIGSKYSDALHHMDDQRFIVPAYITIGGVNPNEGSVTMVNRDSKHHRGSLGTHDFPCRGDFCIITNEDPYEMQDAFDSEIISNQGREYNRYWCGVKHMHEKMEHMSPATIFDAFTQCMTFVPWRGDTFASTFSTSMSAAETSPVYKVMGQEFIK